VTTKLTLTAFGDMVDMARSVAVHAGERAGRGEAKKEQTIERARSRARAELWARGRRGGVLARLQEATLNVGGSFGSPGR
jgi:hypothetical protein